MAVSAVERLTKLEHLFIGASQFINFNEEYLHQFKYQRWELKKDFSLFVDQMDQKRTLVHFKLLSGNRVC